MWLGWTTAALSTELVLDEQTRWADDVSVPLGVTDWKFDEGYVFPVLTEAGAPAGFVFVGAGAASFSLREPGEALALATTLGEQAHGVLDSRQWTEAFDVALVLGPDPTVRQPVEGLPVVSEERDGVLYLEAEDPYTVVVTSYRLEAARRRAQEALHQRTERLARLGIDPRVALDQHALQPDHPRWLGEVHTERVWRNFIEPAQPSMQDQWLSFAHDPTGAIDDTYADTVFVHGLRDLADSDPLPTLRIVTGLLHGANPRGANPRGADPRGATVNRAAVNVVITPGAGVSHAVSLEALLTVETDVDTRLVNLAIPESRTPALEGWVSADGAFRIESVEMMDGTVLSPTGGVFSPWRPAGDWAVQGWVLPEVLPAKGALQLRVRWSDQWPAAGQLDVKGFVLGELQEAGVCTTTPECMCFFGGGLEGAPPPDFRGAFPPVTDLGRVAESRAVVPLSLGGTDTFPAQIRVGTTLGPAWKAAIGGKVRRTDEGGRWWIADVDARARVSFGQYSEDIASAVAGFPEIRVMHYDPINASPEFIRSVIHFFSPSLPPFPAGELVVAQGPSSPVVDPATILKFPCKMNQSAVSRLVHRQPLFPPASGRAPAERDKPWIETVSHQIVVSGLRQIGNEVGGLEGSVRERYPHATERGVVEGVVQQWWAAVSSTRRDGWIARAAGAFYRDLFVREAWPDEVETWDRVRAQDLASMVGERTGTPLVAPEPWNGEVGALFFRGLAARIGEPTLLRGLDQFLRDSEHTTEALHARLEQVAGIDLDSWFDNWVVAGIRPSIRGEWSAERGVVRLTLEGDVPGRIELPVMIVTERAGIRTTWVTLVDGHLETELPTKGTPLRVEIDPEGWLPLRKARLVRQGERPTLPDRVEGKQHFSVR